MLKTLTAYFQYLITCYKCQNCWVASKQEVNDIDVAYCPECGSCNLKVSKHFEV